MNEVINQIDELKHMQKFPRYYLSKYFDELKAQVDTKYALKLVLVHKLKHKKIKQISRNSMINPVSENNHNKHSPGKMDQ